MTITTKALVIKEQTVGESDRLVTLFTYDFGVINAFVRRAKQINNRLAGLTSLFSYGTFTIYRGRDSYSVSDVRGEDVFFSLQKDLESLALAQYFAEIILSVMPYEEPNSELLRLMLNSLYALTSQKKPKAQIKSVFELRAMSLSGFMPSILACEVCGAYETDTMYFNIKTGRLRCADHPGEGGIKIPVTVVKALRFICLAEPEKIMSFSLDDSGMKILSEITEKYLLYRIEKPFKTLEFYKSL